MDFQQNHFALFGLAPSFSIDEQSLEQAYRELQAKVHPDRFANLGEVERRVSMQWSTRVNEAYRTLRRPLARARYLLELRGTDVAAERNTAMPAEFLMEQIEWREAIEEARSAGESAELEKLHNRLRQRMEAMYAQVGAELGAGADVAAAEDVRRLMFYERLREEIDLAIEMLEG